MVQPARPGDDLRGELGHVLQVDAHVEREAVPVVLLAVADRDAVDGHDQRTEPGRLGAVDERLHQRARPQPVELEPLRPGLRGGDLLEREPGDRARDVADAEVRRRLDEADVALGVHEAHAAARRRHHRHRERARRAPRWPCRSARGRSPASGATRAPRTPRRCGASCTRPRRRRRCSRTARGAARTGPWRERPRSSRSGRAWLASRWSTCPCPSNDVTDHGAVPSPGFRTPAIRLGRTDVVVVRACSVRSDRHATRRTERCR